MDHYFRYILKLHLILISCVQVYIDLLNEDGDTALDSLSVSIAEDPDSLNQTLYDNCPGSAWIISQEELSAANHIDKVFICDECL